MTEAKELPRILRETGNEIREWAWRETGPWAEELYRTNCQIASALDRLAEKIEAATPTQES